MNNAIFYGLELPKTKPYISEITTLKPKTKIIKKIKKHNPFLSDKGFIAFLTENSNSHLNNPDFIIDTISERFEKRLGNSFRLMEKVFYSKKPFNHQNFYAAFSIALHHPSGKISSVALKYLKKFVKISKQAWILYKITGTLFKNETLKEKMKDLIYEKLNIKIEKKPLTA